MSQDKPVPPEMVPVTSSNIEAIGHDTRSSDLHVKFKNGGHYAYHGVSRDLYFQMLGADSPGVFHAEHIRSVFKHRKL
jgi:hypothetical protein